MELVTGLVKGFRGHKLGSFTHPRLNCVGKNIFAYIFFLGFATAAHPHCGCGFTAGSKPKISVHEGAQGCSNMWPGEVGNKAGEKQSRVLEYVGGKQEDFFSNAGHQEF